MLRRSRREALAELWNDASEVPKVRRLENLYCRIYDIEDDIFQLRKLFAMEPYAESYPEEEVW